MKLLLSIAIITLISCTAGNKELPSSGMVTEKTVMFSEKVNDSFDIYISKPAKQTSQPLNVVYYCDAGIKSGTALRKIISDSFKAFNLSHTMFVGIGHTGNFHQLRRRDFILPKPGNTDNMYGHADKFYLFLTEELMPLINAHHKVNEKNNSLVGHSLGGLFAFYTLFKNEGKFKNVCALSPSLWVENYDVYNHISVNDSFTVNQRLYFTSGSLEFFNYVKTGAEKMNNYLTEKQYGKLGFLYHCIAGENHNSAVFPGLCTFLKNYAGKFQ